LINADEVFCTGTAVIVSPIGKLSYGGKGHNINQNKIGQVTKKIRETILAIQNEKINDNFGWLKYI
jgi:branched-chain amino acid aminotransferase